MMKRIHKTDWTNTDVKDAKMVYKVFPGAEEITRYQDGSLLALFRIQNSDYMESVEISNKLFPSLKPDDNEVCSVYLDEILGAC